MRFRSGRARARARARLSAAGLLGSLIAAAASAATVSGSVSHAEGARAYELTVPSTGAANARPLIVALHGCLQTPAQFAGVARLRELAEKEGALVLYPAQSEAANPARCWNWFNPADQVRGSGEPALIAAMVEEVRAKHAIDASRIYVVGLSAGAMMTSVLMACYPDVFAAAAVVSGGMYKAADGLGEAMRVIGSGSPHEVAERARQAYECAGDAKTKRYKVLVIDGDADRIVGAANAAQAVAQFLETNDWADDGKDNGSVAALGEPTRARREDGLDHTCRELLAEGRPLMRHCTVHGLGHAWSGGDPGFPYAEPKGPDATAMIWSFFAEQ